MEFAITYLSMLLIIWARYILFSGMFWAAIWGRPEEKVGGTRLAKIRPPGKTMWREAKTSMAVSLIYAVPAAVLIHMWKQGGTAIYNDWSMVRDMIWAPISLLIYLALHDT
ncbi:MAG: fatty acid hydroxylase, partial [Pseudomonadota bacterium]